ncbi:DUF2637 domain-containing protein [Polymorphospora rubra]|uniref:DUF2637 domain-containing protein n=1 Tax=Polymorphospora rubra TaxID=338584 RepID=UPI003401D7E2
MVAVALRFGERPEVAYVLPLSVDGMLVVASAAMMEDKRAGRRVRWSARLAFVAGVVASVAANIAAAQPSLGARIVAAWPAVALLLVVEMLTRSQPVSRPTPNPSRGTRPVQHGVQGSETKPEPAARHPSDTSDSRPEVVAGEPARGRVPLPRRTARPATARRQTRGRAELAADVVARLRVERPDASLAELASVAGVSQRHVRRLLTGGADSSEPTPSTK